MKAPVSNGYAANLGEAGEKKRINSELWHACAGPLVSLPPVGSLVVYFPQGHSEQVAASMQKEIDCIPNYPSLPSKLICVLHDATLHADPETDEVYAQMTLQPVNKYDREAMLASEMGLKQNKQPAEFFCKTLTASDTSTHGGFSVPRRAAEKIFPPLDFTMQPPAQELMAKDLHDISWTFRHIYRGQPKRHLLTTGWSVFVSTKRLTAGDSILFIRDEKSQLLLGIRRASKQQPPLSSSVLSSDSMHIGILAAAAHAATNNSPFTIFYNPRASPSEFVIPLAKYNKAMYTQVSLGMRFRMMFETEECGVRRYMGTVTGISDLDPVRWKNSQWRNLQVGWDESTATERRTRVSLWEIEPVATPFYICPPPFFRPKFSKQPGTSDDAGVENVFQRAMPWLNEDLVMRDAQSSVFPGLSLVQWMALQQNLSSTTPSAHMPPITTAAQDGQPTDDPARLLNFQTHASPVPNLLSGTMLNPQSHQQDQMHYQSHQVILPQQNLLPQASIPPEQPQQLSTLQQKALHLQQQQLPPQQELLNHHLLPQQLRAPANQDLKQHQTSSGQLATQSQLGSQVLHPPHLQRQGLQQAPGLPSLVPNQPSTSSQNFQVQQVLESQNTFSHKQQDQLQQLNQAQLQMQLLQKFQQQEVLPQLNPKVQVQLAQKLNAHSQLFQQSQNVQQGLDAAELTPEQRQLQLKLKSQLLVRTQSTLSTNDVPSSSNPSNHNTTSLSSQNKFLRVEASAVESVNPPIDDFLHELQSKPETRVKHEQFNARESIQQPNHSSLADQLDASSTTSFCLDGGGHDGFSIPPYSDCNVQVDHCDDYFVEANTDALMPDALLSRGLDISSQSFGVPDMTFKAGCSSDAAANQNGALNRGAWSNQPQRMRTYTKVQKRGSVGRCIDVTRYKGYDELRHDLARMFGLEGQLDDPHRSEWKLVYVDHENDILLVGDDPWEEFVSCVQSIKILSEVEVQQISLG